MHGLHIEGFLAVPAAGVTFLGVGVAGRQQLAELVRPQWVLWVVASPHTAGHRPGCRAMRRHRRWPPWYRARHTRRSVFDPVRRRHAIAPAYNRTARRSAGSAEFAEQLLPPSRRNTSSTVSAFLKTADGGGSSRRSGSPDAGATDLAVSDRLLLAPCVTSSAPVRCSGVLVALASRPPIPATTSAIAVGTDDGTGRRRGLLSVLVEDLQVGGEGRLGLLGRTREWDEALVRRDRADREALCCQPTGHLADRVVGRRET